MRTWTLAAAVLWMLGSAAWAAPATTTISSPASGPAAEIIDACAYPDDAAAQAAWKPMSGTANVGVVESGTGGKALKMPCNFKGTSIDRASWDRGVKLDLTGARGVAFEVACDDPTPISHMRIYFQSGGGWYGAPFSVASKDFKTVTIDKAATGIEQAPAGWGTVDTIRISAWRSGDTDTAIRIRDLRMIPGDKGIVVVRGESAATGAKDELDTVCKIAQSMAARLDELGLGYTMISDLDLTAERLAGTKLVILPHNPAMPAAPVAALERYLKGGGKLLSFYGLPDKLQDAVGIRNGKHISSPDRGHFASIRPAKDSLQGMPPVTQQSSWNIREAIPVDGRSKVVADWYDAGGKPTGNAAVVASDNCVVMTHVLLDDDLAAKRRLLLAMTSGLAPGIWPTAFKAAIDRIYRVGPHRDMDEALRLGDVLTDQVRLSKSHDLEQATQLQLDAMAASLHGDRGKAMQLAEEAREHVIRAYCIVEKPLPGEHRAFWCHNAFGVEGMDWDAAVKALADNGFTAVIPNMVWAGAAYYDSKVLPAAADLKDRGDQIKLCLAACRKYGLQCHVWKVNWNMGWRSPKDFMDGMKKDGRTQVDSSGKGNDRWLCPSHPLNQKLEIDSMVEVATQYDVDGIHFDYIRYPGSEGCFCPNCRERFEKLAGKKVEHWPGDVQKGPLRAAWLDFRRSNITAVVAGVSDAVRKARPKMKISAAVFPNWTSDRDSVGQDWKLWCEKGYVDFVCPMDYTASSEEFEGLVRRQVQWAGKVPVYPGIGLSCWGSQGDIFTLLRQITITRAAKTGGFTIFNYDPVVAKETLPLCGAGITKKE